MSNGETPGIGGVPGIAAPKTRAPKAWRNLMSTVTGKGPKQLSDARKATARLRRL